jgi:CelD/BcsL family acetyltransferase involved in cellulose biosynthesis
VIAIERAVTVGPLMAEWDALADRLSATPFARPGWVRAWADAFAARRLVILTARRDGRLAGVLPAVRGPFGELRSATNAHTPHFEVLGEDEDVVRALVGELFSGRPRAVALGCLDPAQPAWAAALAGARAERYRISARVTLRSPYVIVDGDHEAYLSTRRRDFLSDLRRRRRRLAELGEVTFAAADAGEGRAPLLDELLALEATGWKAQRGTAIAAQTATRDFYADVTAWAAERGTLRLLALRVDGRPLAALLGVQDEGVHYLLKGGFDPEHARYSPGQLVLAEAIRRAFDAGVQRVELGDGAAPYKLRWTDAIRERAGLRAFAPTVGGSLEWVAVARGRPLAERAGLDDVLRPLRDRALLASEHMRRSGRLGER